MNGRNDLALDGLPEISPATSNVAFAALLACGIFLTIGLFAPALLLPQIERAFAVEHNASLLTQLIGGVTCFFFAIGSPLAGLIIGRVGSRAVILPSVVLFTVSGVAPMLIDDLSLIVATRAVVGMAVAGIFTGALTAIGQLPDRQRQRLFGYLSVTSGIAALVLFPTVAELAKFGWRMGFTVYLIGIAVLPILIAIPASLGRSTHAAVANVGRATEPFLNRSLVGLLIIAALAGISIFIGGLFAPLYLASSLGVTDTRLLAVPSTLGSVASPIAAAFYGVVYRRVGSDATMILALGGLAVAFALAGAADGLILFSIAMMVSGFMFGLLTPHVNAVALAHSSPVHASSVIGLANGVLFGSQLLAPFFVSAVQMVAAPAGVFIALAATLALTGLALGGHSRLYRRSVPSSAS